MSRFARWLIQDGRARLTGDYLELWRWSTERLEEFWSAVWDYFDVRSAAPYERVLSGSVMPDVQWFTGAQVSYVEHLFRGRDPERVALIDARESARPGAGPVSRRLTWGMLREQVGDLAAMLRDLGVEPGDRVAGRLGWPSPAGGSAELAPRAVPFGHPLWVLFSSGTTGRPKGIVHSTGGVLLEHMKAMSLSLDLGEQDTFFWYTSPSWMVWNYLVSALLAGARIVCYDGSSSHPSWDTVWALAAEHHVTLLGTSPAHLRTCAQAGVEPARDHDLSALRSLGSSGSALPGDAYVWAADHVGRRVRVNSTSGGTDVVSAFAGGSPIVPVWPGELSAPSLGVALDSWDARGGPVRGAVGELVVTKPMQGGDPHQVMDAGAIDSPDALRWFAAYQTRESIP